MTTPSLADGRAVGPVLLTGFEPFAGDRINTSGEAVRALGARWPDAHTLVTAVVPVEFATSAELIGQLVAEHHPVAVIATGLAGRRRAVTPETTARNIDDARVPDNAGAQPRNQPIDPLGPATLATRLPVAEIVTALRAADIPAELSHDAGEFVCNHVFYQVLSQVPAPTPAGFVHLPWAAEHDPDGVSTIPLETLVRALGVTVETVISSLTRA